jgi:hypothetical protein
MNRITLAVGIAAALLCATSAWAANSVVVEPRTVSPGATDISVGIYFSNDIDVESIEAPFEIRTLTGGSYWTSYAGYTVQSRLSSSFQFYVVNTRPTPAVQSCSGPVSSTWTGNSAPDYISPDGARLLAAIGCMTAGSDGSPGAGTPSLVLTFDVNCAPGTFEIDTCCFTPGQHLRYYQCGTATPYTPSFTKSVITIDPAADVCVCNDRPADVNCDGVVNVFDVTIVVDVAFRSAPEPDPCCADGP